MAVLAEQRSQHAEEGISCAGGGVCCSPRSLPGLRPLPPAGSAGSTAGLAQECSIPSQEGESRGCGGAGQPLLGGKGWGRQRGSQVCVPRCSVLLSFFPQPRLKCLFHIVKQLSAEHEPFVTALVPEVSVVPGRNWLVLWWWQQW